MLTASRLRELLRYDPETGLFTWHTRRGRIAAGSVAGVIGGEGYFVIRVDYRLHLAHRLAWLYMTGEWPQATVDHRDTDRTNNRWTNLRDASYGQNNANSVKPNRTGLKGIKRHGHRYVAQISVGGINRHLGCFSSPEEAHAAYIAAATQHFGEFARLNNATGSP